MSVAKGNQCVVLLDTPPGLRKPVKIVIIPSVLILKFGAWLVRHAFTFMRLINPDKNQPNNNNVRDARVCLIDRNRYRFNEESAWIKIVFFTVGRKRPT